MIFYLEDYLSPTHLNTKLIDQTASCAMDSSNITTNDRQPLSSPQNQNISPVMQSSPNLAIPTDTTPGMSNNFNNLSEENSMFQHDKTTHEASKPNENKFSYPDTAVGYPLESDTAEEIPPMTPPPAGIEPGGNLHPEDANFINTEFQPPMPLSINVQENNSPMFSSYPNPSISCSKKQNSVMFSMQPEIMSPPNTDSLPSLGANSHNNFSVAGIQKTPVNGTPGQQGYSSGYDTSSLHSSSPYTPESNAGVAVGSCDTSSCSTTMACASNIASTSRTIHQQVISRPDSE